MFETLIEKCNTNLESMDCCHKGAKECNCYQCLSADFHEMPDDYNCEKKLNYYVLKYGSSYTSEIYHYFESSKILEDFNGKAINVLSLGCGFAPDYYAIMKYIKDMGLEIKIKYYGIDNSNYWESARVVYRNTKYLQNDLLDPFSFENFDLIIMNKVFSTIYKHGNQDIFIDNLVNAIDNTMPLNALLIFNDINHIDMGRDYFHNRVNQKFRKVRQYYCGPAKYTEYQWKKIANDRIVFPLVDNRDVDPIAEIRCFVYFEYRK